MFRADPQSVRTRNDGGSGFIDPAGAGQSCRPPARGPDDCDHPRDPPLWRPLSALPRSHTLESASRVRIVAITTPQLQSPSIGGQQILNKVLSDALDRYDEAAAVGCCPYRKPKPASIMRLSVEFRAARNFSAVSFRSRSTRSGDHSRSRHSTTTAEQLDT